MRVKISDKNVFPYFSIRNEYIKLQALFEDETAFGKTYEYVDNDDPNMSYEYCLQYMFLNWKLRGTFTSLDEMKAGLGIRKYDIERNPNEEILLDYIQFILNAIDFVDAEVESKKYSIYSAGHTIRNAIIDNCNYLLEKFTAETIKEEDELFVVYKDEVAMVVAGQCTDEKNSITEYLKIDNRGDIQRKGEILCTLSKKLESFEKDLNGTEFKQLCSDTTFLLNSIGARHHLNCENKHDAVFMKMDTAELEEWYDKTFQMILACMASKPYISYKSNIKSIKNPKIIS